MFGNFINTYKRISTILNNFLDHGYVICAILVLIIILNYQREVGR